jgi:hypothetical protein
VLWADFGSHQITVAVRWYGKQHRTQRVHGRTRRWSVACGRAVLRRIGEMEATYRSHAGTQSPLITVSPAMLAHQLLLVTTDHLMVVGFLQTLRRVVLAGEHLTV